MFIQLVSAQEILTQQFIKFHDKTDDFYDVLMNIRVIDVLMIFFMINIF